MKYEVDELKGGLVATAIKILADLYDKFAAEGNLSEEEWFVVLDSLKLLHDAFASLGFKRADEEAA